MIKLTLSIYLERKIKMEGFSTLCIHAGTEPDKTTGAIERPITMANSYLLPYDPTDMNWSDANAVIYTRNGGANQKYLEERVAKISGATDCVCLASGVAALSGTFFALLEKGDHVIFSDVTYIAVYRLLNELFNNKFGIETTIMDTSDIEAVKKAIKPNTKLIHTETPGNPTLKIVDIKALAAAAHENGVLLSVDNTFCSPYNQRPLELGADIVIESMTKYINGHGDAMGGCVVSNDHNIINKIKEQSMVNLGGTLSPFNAWLIMRGIETLPLRMKQHNINGQRVAEYLESLPCVSFVAYPGLKSHKGYDIAKKQMKGFGAMLSFGLKTDHDTHNRFVSQLKVITSAVSLGHGASLIVFIGEDDERMYLYPEEFKNGFFRMSVGLEDADDIIGDINQALKAVGLL